MNNKEPNLNSESYFVCIYKAKVVLYACLTENSLPRTVTIQISVNFYTAFLAFVTYFYIPSAYRCTVPSKLLYLFTHIFERILRETIFADELFWVTIEKYDIERMIFKHKQCTCIICDPNGCERETERVVRDGWKIEKKFAFWAKNYSKINPFQHQRSVCDTKTKMYIQY